MPGVGRRHVRDAGRHGRHAHGLRPRGRPQQPRRDVQRQRDARDALGGVTRHPRSRLPAENRDESQKFAGKGGIRTFGQSIVPTIWAGIENGTNDSWDS